MEYQMEARVKNFLSHAEGSLDVKKLFNEFHPSVIKTELAYTFLANQEFASRRYVLVEFMDGKRAVCVVNGKEDSGALFVESSLVDEKFTLATEAEIQVLIGYREGK